MIAIHNDQRDSVDCTQQTSEVLNPDIQTRNRFDALNVEENTSNDATETKTDHSRAATDHETQSVNCSKKQPIKRTIIDQDEAYETQRRDEQSRHRKPVNMAILGDSMLKYVNSAQLRKNTKANTQIKTFPGAKVDDMKFYVKPTLARTCSLSFNLTHWHKRPKT